MGCRPCSGACFDLCHRNGIEIVTGAEKPAGLGKGQVAGGKRNVSNI